MIFEYNEDYYKQNNYVSYLERYERYNRLMNELHYDLFKKINLDKEISSNPILDFGCAVGFTVHSLQNLGYNVHGYDISNWAINYGIEHKFLSENNTIRSISDVYSKNWSLVISLDVLEHLSHENLYDFIKNIKSKFIIMRVPVSKEDNGKYILNISENDKTHVIRWTSERWDKEFQSFGYLKMFTINLGNMYESDGVHCVMYKHE